MVCLAAGADLVGGTHLPIYYGGSVQGFWRFQRAGCNSASGFSDNHIGFDLYLALPTRQTSLQRPGWASRSISARNIPNVHPFRGAYSLGYQSLYLLSAI